MNKINYKTISGIKIYSIKYLINNELTDADLSNLLDNNKIGLKYSLIIGMFRLIKSKKTNLQIIKLINSDDFWYDKYFWTKEQQNQYESYVIDVYKNIYQYKDLTAISLGQWFMSIYGLSVK